LLLLVHVLTTAALVEAVDGAMEAQLVMVNCQEEIDEPYLESA
jgi:hypothetical protein